MKRFAVLLPLAGLLAAACLAGAAAHVTTFPGRNGKIVLVRQAGKMSSGLLVVGADGTGARTIRRAATRTIASEPTWSPDGRFVAFSVVVVPSASRPPSSSALWRMDANGRGRKLLARTPRYRVDSGIRWSPDGRRLAFLRLNLDCTAGNRNCLATDLWVMNSDGTRKRKLAAGVFAVVPAWSPDGEEIAVGRAGSRGIDLYAYRTTGGGSRRLTRDPGYEFSPVWSSDGSRLAFMTLEGIAVVRADGTGQRPVTASSDLSPAWSPTGDRIAFIRTDVYRGRRNAAVYVTDPDGLSAKPIVLRLGRPLSDPVWSPDGSKLLFTLLQQGTAIVYLVNADGSGSRRLARGYEPDWQPLRG